VCGKYILPILGDERVNCFSVRQIPGKEFHCDNACAEIVKDCGGDWTKLPPGPLRSVYEKAQKEIKKATL
jgi:hypothetical protein